MIEIKKLELLAAHLERGKLFHEKFDILVYHQQYDSRKPPRECQTLGCAIGECPGLWPEDWAWTDNGVRLTRGQRSNMLAARVFFELSGAECEHLFMAGHQFPDRFGGELLDSNATAAQVAANIRAFIDVQTKTGTPHAR